MVSMGEHAVVLGGGIGGLATALALAPSFDEVTIVERGAYPEPPMPRAHAPQGAHVHALLARGLAVVSALVPEIPAWLDEAGLREGDLTWDVLFCFGGQWLPRVRSGIPVRACTRPRLESLLLRAVSRLPNARIRSGCKVVGLRGTTRITGVEIVDERGERARLESDWTVDATGRSSHVLEWLARIGVTGIAQEVVDPGVVYTSCSFEPDGSEPDWLFMADASRFPSQPEMGVLQVVEQGKWLAALIGYGRAGTPKSVDELVDRIGRLSSDRMGTLLRSGAAAGELVHFGNTANRRRRFGAVAAWPDRFVVLGDAACAMNPRYGQGMTLAALGVETLLHTLREGWRPGRGLDGLAIRFQRALERALAVPWQVALMEDRLWVSRFQGRALGWADQVLARSSQALLDTAFTDVDTYIRFMSVAHMIRSPASLASPRVVAKVLLPSLRRAGASAGVTPPAP